MKKLVLVGFAVIISSLVVSGCTTARTDNAGPDLSWWPTDATPQPVEDQQRGGYWWWPAQQPEGDTADAEQWGNRGYIYVRKDLGKEEVVPVEQMPTQVQEDIRKIERVELQDVHFEYNKAVLSAEGKKSLDEVAEILERNPDFKLSIEGHTCSIGSEAYNEKLGLRRAESAKKYLIGKGINPDRLRAISWGETRLKYKERDSKDFALNRRVEFRVNS